MAQWQSLDPALIRNFELGASYDPDIKAKWEEFKSRAQWLNDNDFTAQLRTLQAEVMPKVSQIVAKKNAEDKARADRAALDARIRAFVDEMSAPLSENDPIVKSLRGMAIDNNQAAAGRSGMWGGSGEGIMSQAAQMRNLLPYAQQRQQMAQQGLGLLSQRDLSTQDLELRRQQMQAQADQQAWAAQQNTNAGIGSGIGTVLGGIAGGVLTAATAGAALPLVPSLISGGGALGAGAGALTTRSYKAPSYYGY